jgi:uncharacterized membrane protein
VAWAAKWSSINFDFPFGWYVYHYHALENDLIVFSVPIFDSLSFMFLSYVNFSFAQFFLSSLQGRGLAVRRVVLRRVRNSRLVLLLGAALVVVIDLIADSVANLRKYWFLGNIHHYVEPRVYFGVPLMNYVWRLVHCGNSDYFYNQRMDGYLAERKRHEDRTSQLVDLSYSGVMAPVLWFGIVLFHPVVA